ncbi:four helix bundle protein [Candidatus Curtissbacteria bacterium]|nr:four helix bundle protein [Candidatus Curtissbacteria bacterium]
MGNFVGYKYLKSYHLATIIYDLTFEFCNRYISLKSRTHDQMVQAARSGKQNIAEGYLERSLKMYIKLAGVSRGSLGELLEDYEDYARQHKIELWPVEKTRGMREIRAIRKRSTATVPYIPNLPDNPTEAVNLLITLLNQANFLLDRQIASLEEKFVKEGGYTEKLFKRRAAVR